MEVQKILDNYWTSENCEERASTDLRESISSHNRLALGQEREEISSKAVLT
jgi:hypothetical protein